MEIGHFVLKNAFRDLRNSEYYFLSGVVIAGEVMAGGLLISEDKLVAKVDSIELRVDDLIVIRVLIPDDFSMADCRGKEIIVFTS